ncbi:MULTISPECIES: hypothetical protein [unclassified Aquabacterium]|uniref:hypothetical protein n=1 Tax=unclassified Aquabacterium TaxID=2620789 RepID=UPI001F2DCD96|nr:MULTISPECIES: hypothetical protein [unclassified Aquabacterium]
MHTITTGGTRLTATRAINMVSTVSISTDRRTKAAITITLLWHRLHLRRQIRR